MVLLMFFEALYFGHFLSFIPCNLSRLSVAKNIADFYANFTSERWTLTQLPRLDNVLAWQSEFRCQCLHPRDPTKVTGFGPGSPGYILKRSLGLPTMAMEDHPETCLFCMYGLW